MIWVRIPAGAFKMKISFFEEYLTRKNLRKLRLINFPTKLYIAAPSLRKFNSIKNKIKNKKVKQIIYWPVLSREEGYWISPFSKTKALRRIFDEVQDKNIIVMLDLEPPFTRKRLLISEMFNFFRSKSFIKKFIKKHEVIGCESYHNRFFLRFFGLSYDIKNEKTIKMFYSSMVPFSRKTKDKMLENLSKKGFIVALGTITKGEAGNEPILSPEELDKDLAILKKNNVKEVIIYRLGGLNKNYIRILKKYS